MTLTRWARSPVGPINFGRINTAAIPVLAALLKRWLPGGRIQGAEYVACNPKRADHSPGSFKVNLRTGRWSDFATKDAGRDPISLAAYLAGITQIDAAERLTAMLGVQARDAR